MTEERKGLSNFKELLGIRLSDKDLRMMILEA